MKLKRMFIVTQEGIGDELFASTDREEAIDFYCHLIYDGKYSDGELCIVDIPLAYYLRKVAASRIREQAQKAYDYARLAESYSNAEMTFEEYKTHVQALADILVEEN